MQKKLLELRWPIGIAVATLGLVLLSAVTIVKSMEYPVTESDYFHTKYQNADLNGDKIFESQVAFKKLYSVSLQRLAITYPNAENGVKGASIVAYQVLDKAGFGVDDATFEVVVTRPNSKKYDIVLENPVVKNGVYTFPEFTVPLEGRWDVLARITVGDKQSIYNVKADTRYANYFEF